MAVGTLEQRVAVLESEVTELKQSRTRPSGDSMPWWERVRGDFKDDPDYAEATRLGREYRESLQPPDDADQPE